MGTSRIETYISNFGTIEVLADLELRGRTESEGIITIGNNIDLDLYGGPHNFRPESILDFNYGSQLAVRSGQTTLNRTSGSLEIIFVTGKLDIFMDDSDTNITQIRLFGSSSAKFQFHGSKLRCEVIDMQTGHFNFFNATVETKQLMVHGSLTKYLIGNKLLVTDNVDVPTPISDNKLHIGGIVELSGGAELRLTSALSLYRTPSQWPTIFRNRGQIVIHSVQVFDVRVPFENKGRMVVAGRVHLYASQHDMAGHVHMLTDGAIIHYDGNFIWSNNATSSGDLTVALYGDRSYIYAKSTDPDTKFTINMYDGQHELEVDDIHYPEIHIIGGAGRGHRVISINGSNHTPRIQTIYTSHSVHVVTKEHNHLHAREVQLIAGGSIRGPGTISVAALTWTDGTFSDGLTAAVSELAQIGLPTKTPSLTDTNLTFHGLVLVKEVKTMYIQRASVCVTNSSRLVLEKSFILKHVNDLHWTRMQVDGDMTLATTDVFFTTDVDLTVNGEIQMNNNMLSAEKFVHNGRLLDAKEIRLYGRTSVFTNLSTTDISSGLPSTSVVITEDAGFTLYANATFANIYGHNGLVLVPEGIEVNVTYLRADSGFTLQVDGTMIVDHIFLNGGSLVSSGTVTANTVDWVAGTILSPSTRNISIPSLTCMQRFQSRSGTSKSLNHAFVVCKGNAILHGGTNIVMKDRSVISAVDTMHLIHGVTITSEDTQSFMENTGHLQIEGGTEVGATKLHSSIRNQGIMSITKGYVELGSKDSQSLYNGNIDITPGTSVKFSGGRHTFHADTNFYGMGELEVNGDTADIHFQDGKGNFTLTSMQVSAGTIRISRQHKLHTIREVYIRGGQLIVEGPCHIGHLSVALGELLTRTEIVVETIYMEQGNIASDKRQSRIKTNVMKWTGGVLKTAVNKRFQIDVMNTMFIIGITFKEIQNSVVLSLKDVATFGSLTPVKIRSGGSIVVGEKAKLTILSGEVVNSPPSENGMLINDGTIEIGTAAMTTSFVTLSSFFQNNGKMLVRNSTVSFKNGGNFGANSGYFESGSAIEVRSGSLTISLTAFAIPVDVQLFGGTLVLQSGVYDTVFDVHIRGGQLNIISSDDDLETVFPGRLYIDGGDLNVTGQAELTGQLNFHKGLIRGTGAATISKKGHFNVLYGDSISDSRAIDIKLLSFKGVTKIMSPVIVDSGGVVKVAEDTTLLLEGYSSLDGRGRLINVGNIDARTQHYMSKITLNLHNYWMINSTQGGAFLEAFSQNKIILHDTSLVSGSTIISGDGVQTGGTLHGSLEISGTLAIKYPTYITRTARWIRGTITVSDNSCNNRNYRPPSHLMVSPCVEPFLLIEGELLIENSEYDKIIGDGTKIVNEGRVIWTAGRIRGGQATLINNGIFKVNTTNDPLVWDRLDSRRQSYIVNNMEINIKASKINLRTRLTNNGILALNQNSELTLEQFEQRDVNAFCSGNNATFIYTHGMSISNGRFEWKGWVKVNGALTLDAAILAPNDYFILNGNLDFSDESELHLNIRGPSDYDRITVSGSVTFRGRIHIDWNGNTPAPGSEFPVMSWTGSHNGEFSVITNTLNKVIVVGVQYTLNDLTILRL